MRPLHIGLLVVGAALAGGLAVKMSEPPPIPVAAVSAPPVPPAQAMTSAPAPAPVAVPEVIPQPEKPSPMPDPPVLAPPPTYSEPELPKAPIRINKPRSEAAKAVPMRVAESRPLPVYDSPPQFVAEPVAAPVKTPAPEPAPASAAVVAPPRHVTLRSGTAIDVRIEESLSSDRNAGGDTFDASLADPLVVDGLVIAERGAHVSGRVRNSQKAGRGTGTSFLELGLGAITTSDGQHIAISTDSWTQRGDTSRVEEAAKIGGGAALGAIIGAVAGGGKGAAIGAGAGGLAGAGAVVATRGKPATISSETIVRFRLASAVTITERR